MRKLVWVLFFCLPVLVRAQLADSNSRLVHVQGTVNFRDIGGYKTADGHTVSWNKLYRSADISHLTAVDLDTMKGRHIRTVVDFRGVRESEPAPDRLPAGVAYLLCPAGSDSLPTGKEMAAMMTDGQAMLLKMYGNPQYLGPRYKAFFSLLLTSSSDEAVLYHCTGGRDRTGMATALLLNTLGVPMGTIEADFVASNVYLEPLYQRMFKGAAQIGVDPEKVRKSMELTPALLEAMFAGIRAKYGTVENFMQVELGVGPEQVKVLRAKYLK